MNGFLVPVVDPLAGGTAGGHGSLDHLWSAQRPGERREDDGTQR
jgi:hypothetical protein